MAEKHETLNSKLWNVKTNELKPEVSEKAMQIANEFIDNIAKNNIPVEVTDVVLVGSNCSYNYSDKSDLDIHIRVDLSKFDDDKEKRDMVLQLYNLYRKTWEDKYTISFYDIPVELYVETKFDELNEYFPINEAGEIREEKPLISNGIYSVLNNKWIKEPVAEDIPEIDNKEVDDLVAKIKARYDEILKSVDQDLQEMFVGKAYDVALQKMQDFDAGRRKENIRACGENKLLDYYEICLRRNLKNAARQIKAELINRGYSNTFVDNFEKNILGYSQKAVQPATAPAQQTPVQQAPVAPSGVTITLCGHSVWRFTVSEDDFTEDILKEMLDKSYSGTTLVTKTLGSSTGTWLEKTKQLLIRLILAIVLKKPALADKAKNVLSELPIYSSNKQKAIDEIKGHVNAIVSNNKVREKIAQLTALIDGLQEDIDPRFLNNTIGWRTMGTSTNLGGQTNNSTPVTNTVSNTTSNSNGPEINSLAPNGQKMYRLVTYNKDYNPPARQHLILRRKNKATGLYGIGIEGQPRQTSWLAEPLFDSIAQAEKFAKNSVYLNTKRNVKNFKFNIVSKPIKNLADDLSDYELIDTVLGSAYIHKRCQYFDESLDTTIVEDIVDGDENAEYEARSIIADQISGEWDAIQNYNKAVADLEKLDGSFDSAIDILNDISTEEEVHVGELQKLQSLLNDKTVLNIEEGEEEATEKLFDAPVEENLTEEIHNDRIDAIDEFLENLFALRAAGLEDGGEYSIENLAFKAFRMMDTLID